MPPSPAPSLSLRLLMIHGSKTYLIALSDNKHSLWQVHVGMCAVIHPNYSLFFFLLKTWKHIPLFSINIKDLQWVPCGDVELHDSKAVYFPKSALLLIKVIYTCTVNISLRKLYLTMDSLCELQSIISLVLLPPWSRPVKCSHLPSVLKDYLCSPSLPEESLGMTHFHSSARTRGAICFSCSLAAAVNTCPGLTANILSSKCLGRCCRVSRKSKTQCCIYVTGSEGSDIRHVLFGQIIVGDWGKRRRHLSHFLTSTLRLLDRQLHVLL